MRTWSALIIGAALFVAFPSLASTLALERVVLSSGGLGYFEYEADVDGHAELELDVPLEQVDDVLKSLVIYDDQGAIGTTTLPGREPASRALHDLPFAPSALDSSAETLLALRGEEVTVRGPQTLRGRLVSVEQKQHTSPSGEKIQHRHRVTLATDTGLAHFVLEEAESIDFSNRSLSGDINTALSRLASGRERDARRLTITMQGDGQRRVRAAYVVEVPIWKTAYRLTLSRDTNATEAAMQGWAILENMSGVNWSDVELTLSGHPVALRQALYESYYVERPEVPMAVIERLLPNLDRGSIALEGAAMEDSAAPTARLGSAPTASMAEAAPEERFSAAPSAIGIDAEEATTQINFRFATPVSVAQGQTLTLPIIDRALPAEQIALYRPTDTASRHPLASLRLANDSDSGLPAGILTLYSQDSQLGAGTLYLGDARLDALPSSDRRLVSYALDQNVTIEQDEGDSTRLDSGHITDGTLHIVTRERHTATYRMKNTAGEERSLLIEHPMRRGWQLVAPDDQDIELSEGHYRIPITLAADSDGEVLEVVLERPVEESLALIDGSRERIASFARASELDEPTRARLLEVLAHYQTLGALDSEIEAHAAEESDIVADQQRLRDNLAQVPAGSDLARRYLTRLDDQESELEALRDRLSELRQRHADARQALIDQVRRTAPSD